MIGGYEQTIRAGILKIEILAFDASGQTLFERVQGPLLALFPPGDQAFYQKIDGRTPLQLLCTKGPGGVPENARLLYVFFCLGLIRRIRGSGGGAKKIQYKTEGGTLGN